MTATVHVVKLGLHHAIIHVDGGRRATCNLWTLVVVSSTTVLRCLTIRCHMVVPKEIEAFHWRIRVAPAAAAAVVAAAVVASATRCAKSFHCIVWSVSLPLAFPFSPTSASSA